MPLTIEYVDPATLKPAAYNPRRIRPAALKRLVRLLDEHGFVNPVIARRSDRLILGGHQRIKANALRERPDRLVPVVFVDDIDDRQAKALNVALNNPAAGGEFDVPRLAELVGELADAGVDLPAATGFPPAEIRSLLATLDALEPPTMPEEAAPPQADILVIFELTRQQYEKVKPQLDALIAGHELTCHVRMEG